MIDFNYENNTIYLVDMMNGKRMNDWNISSHSTVAKLDNQFGHSKSILLPFKLPYFTFVESPIFVEWFLIDFSLWPKRAGNASMYEGFA